MLPGWAGANDLVKSIKFFGNPSCVTAGKNAAEFRATASAGRLTRPEAILGPSRSNTDGVPTDSKLVLILGLRLERRDALPHGSNLARKKGVGARYHVSIACPELFFRQDSVRRILAASCSCVFSSCSRDFAT